MLQKSTFAKGWWTPQTKKNCLNIFTDMLPCLNTDLCRWKVMAFQQFMVSELTWKIFSMFGAVVFKFYLLGWKWNLAWKEKRISKVTQNFFLLNLVRNYMRYFSKGTEKMNSAIVIWRQNFIFLWKFKPIGQKSSSIRKKLTINVGNFGIFYVTVPLVSFKLCYSNVKISEFPKYVS